MLIVNKQVEYKKPDNKNNKETAPEAVGETWHSMRDVFMYKSLTISSIFTLL